jgi:hypothetical protein
MVAELDVVGIARNRRREALRIGAKGCEENDFNSPDAPKFYQRTLVWLAAVPVDRAALLLDIETEWTRNKLLPKSSA